MIKRILSLFGKNEVQAEIKVQLTPEEITEKLIDKFYNLMQNPNAWDYNFITDHDLPFEDFMNVNSIQQISFCQKIKTLKYERIVINVKDLRNIFRKETEIKINEDIIDLTSSPRWRKMEKDIEVFVCKVRDAKNIKGILKSAEYI